MSTKWLWVGHLEALEFRASYRNVTDLMTCDLEVTQLRQEDFEQPFEQLLWRAERGRKRKRHCWENRSVALGDTLPIIVFLPPDRLMCSHPSRPSHGPSSSPCPLLLLQLHPSFGRCVSHGFDKHDCPVGPTTWYVLLLFRVPAFIFTGCTPCSSQSSNQHL